ncbi:MAG: OmpA family protein, partial [Longimicrobiales bacterium]|nr:OmpA family protein [Longimicrobiales bacterium]
TRGETPAEADVVESLYGGFVMGPRVALTGAWRRAPDATLQVVGSVARLWAGARGGWTVQAGVRWTRPPRPTTFTRPIGSGPTPGPAAPPRADPPDAPQEAAPDTTRSAQDATTTTGDPALLARLDELERALQQEREARLRLQASADSADEARRAAAAEAAAQAQAAAARADSLAAVADTLARREREREAREAAVAAVEGRLRDLVGVLPSVQSVTRSDQGLVVTLGGSLFPTGATALGTDGRPQVERVARVILDGPYQSLVVSGHTDATGSADTNLVISRARAQAVRQVLVESGLEPRLVEVVAAGEQEPVAPHDTSEGRRLNGRVEIFVRTPDVPGR